TYRTELQETYQFAPVNFWGKHEFKAGLNYSHNSYDGRSKYLPVDIVGNTGSTIERIQFWPASNFNVSQDEAAWFVGDNCTPIERVTIDFGARFDHDSVTKDTNVAPRGGIAIALTRDNKTLLKAGAGLFYDRVPLNIPVFALLPARTILNFDA